MNSNLKLPIFLYMSAVLCLLLYLACGKPTPNSNSAQTIPLGSIVIQNITEIKSEIIESQSSSWKTSVTRVSGREALNSVFFLDNTHGWVAGESALYKTSNGGGTWERTKINVPSHAEIADIFFINASLGWIALQRHVADAAIYQGNKFWLMHTNDGGESWRLQYEDEGAVITHVSFVDDKRGWLTGVKYTGLGPLRFNFLVLRTADQGQHWADVSGELNQIAKNDEGIVNDWITDIILEDSLTATVLTLRGKVFTTVNDGKSWQQVGNIRDEPPQTCICRLGIKEGRHLWVAGGADSEEGIWGMLAVKQDDNSWTRYNLGGVYFADALFLSESQVLACGANPPNRDARIPSNQRSGVILYSSDKGRNWSIAYRNAQIKSINALAAVNSRHVWAVGENGLVVHLEPSSVNVISR